MPGDAAPAVESLSFDEFCGLEQPWNDLVSASQAPVPFLTHEWLRVWWRCFGAGQTFLALVVRDGSTLLAGAPLALRRARFLGLRATVAEIVGTGPVPTRGMGLADKADLPFRNGSPEAAHLLAAGVVELLQRVDVIDVKGCDGSSPTLPALIAAAPRPRRVRVLDRSVSPYLTLTGTWEEYLQSRSGNFRKHLRKYRRELEKRGTVEVVGLSRGVDLAAWIDEIVEINRASWKAGRGTNLLRHPGLVEFVSEVVRTMERKGWIDLRLLRVGARALAYELCFDFGGRVFSYNGSFRAEAGDLSPGTALTAAVIESACGRGRMEYDMLRGDEGYKTRWSETSRSESRLVMPAERWRARVYAHVALHLKARLKESRRLNEVADRLSGLLSRVRYREP